MGAGNGYAIGIDLGTSNTVAVVRWPDGRTRPLLFDGQPILPSAVYLDEQGRLHIGRDAQRLAQLDPTRYEPNPKRRIDETTVLLGDREGPVVGLLSAILQLIAAKARETCGLLPPAVLTYPAAWGASRRGLLQEAATRAGWPLVRLLPEPIAAARYFADTLHHPIPDGGALAVFDFGGGTLDIAVVRNQNGAFEVIGSGGAEDLGGLDVDAALVNHLGGLLASRHPEVWRQLSAPVTPTDRRHRRLFWEDVRGAKEMLSRATVAPVPIPGVDQALHVTREELEQLARPLLIRAVEETAGVIDQCGLASGQLSGVFLVGGTSRIPLVAQMLHQRLGFAPTALEQPELPVAEGALAELVAADSPATFQVPVGAVGGTSAPAGAPVSPAGPAPVSPAVPTPVSPPVGFPPGPPGPPPARSWFRRPWVYAAAGALALTMLAASLFYVYANREAPFTNLTNVATFAFQGTALPTEIQNGRAYLPAYNDDGALQVTAVDLESGKLLWRKRLPGKATWEDFVAHQRVFTVYGTDSDGTETLHVRDLETGKQLYREEVADNVWYTVHEDRLIRADPDAGKFSWIDLSSGNRVGSADYAGFYHVDTWAEESQSAAHFKGYRFESPEPDNRAVTINSLGTMRVLDAASGRQLDSGRLLAFTGEPDIRGYAGKLLVIGQADGTTGFQVYAYDLDSPAKPKRLYADKTKDRTVEHIEPCGEELICVVDSAGALIPIDLASGGNLWRKNLGEPDNVGAVNTMGDVIMVSHSQDEKFYTSFFDHSGEVVAREPGLAAPVDETTALLVSPEVAWVSSGGVQVNTSEISVKLEGLGALSGEKSPIGTFDAIPSTCSWNHAYIVCATDEQFQIHRFRDV